MLGDWSDPGDKEHYLKSDNDNVVDIQTYLLRNEFEQYKQDLHKKELERKRNIIAGILLLIGMTVLIWLTID
jgi:hypothetical protein